MQMEFQPQFDWIKPQELPDVKSKIYATEELYLYNIVFLYFGKSLFVDWLISAGLCFVSPKYRWFVG